VVNARARRNPASNQGGSWSEELNSWKPKPTI
jgi:hypothetical protein